MRVRSGGLYIFTKSGSEVRAKSTAEPYMGKPCWTVERTQGGSAGKQLIVPAGALVAAL